MQYVQQGAHVLGVTARLRCSHVIDNHVADLRRSILPLWPASSPVRKGRRHAREHARRFPRLRRVCQPRGQSADHIFACLGQGKKPGLGFLDLLAGREIDGGIVGSMGWLGLGPALAGQAPCAR